MYVACFSDVTNEFTVCEQEKDKLIKWLLLQVLLVSSRQQMKDAGTPLKTALRNS